MAEQSKTQSTGSSDIGCGCLIALGFIFMASFVAAVGFRLGMGVFA